MPETLAKTTWFEQRQQTILPNFELSEVKVLPIVEYFANVQVGEYFELVFKPGFLQSSLDNLLLTVEKKFKAAGYTVEENIITSNNDGSITFRKQSDTTILLSL
uniref:tRNA-synt_2 domain-containing protein n=1 Tax=Panagrellus redivivus TaxID=6233 RepID=A0A7E4VEV9_PANRE